MAHGCVLCHRNFDSQQALQQHMDSLAHNFDCEKCNENFSSQQALQQHLDSPAHSFIFEGNKSFGTKQALQQHLNSPAHSFIFGGDKSFGTKQASRMDSESPAHIPATSVKYIGVSRSVVSPVYATALKLRFQQPTVDDILRHIDTKLDKLIVSTLIAAALRLLPVDNTPNGIALRTEKSRVTAVKAKDAEDSFCAALSRRGLRYLRESQEQGEASTPDVRFEQPTFICGHLCSWLEYKNYFGFRANPFLASKNKKQFRRYATKIGPGAVVYKLGFETGHLNIDGVMTFREEDVLQDLEMKCMQ
ncbi:hypothetical protein B7494_g6870 [Chlorociboria aeruginascens]|nr:hypothetical protein B7494_g6870 [Chlorociboria aeruginascens]